MLSEIVFVLLVLVVAVLMAVDLARTRNESGHGHAERQGFGADRVMAAPSRASGVSMFAPEPVMATVPAPAAAPAPARHAEPPRAFDQDASGSLRAFDQDASRPTASDPDRDRLNGTFVNLSHRSQSLVERQLRLIEDLEHGEQDVRRLTSLSKLNRIAVRIYRNSQNLLILAGHQSSQRWDQPVTLGQLVRAALDEVEDFERISIDVQADVAVRGPAVNDLVHLLVELVENATSFSAAEMPVHITAQVLTSGGALVDISDRGIGMTAKDMAYANQQLDHPPAGDIGLPKWMGLLVVARLAARHGIRVRLNQADLGGLTALVWLPDEILTHYGATAGPALTGQRAAADGSTAFTPPRTSAPEPAATQRDPAWSARNSQATLQAEPVTVRLSGPGRLEAPNADVDVVMPHAESQTRNRGLPIFDEVESRWTRGSHEASGPAVPTTASGLATTPGPATAFGPPATAPATGGPAPGGPATAGLPRRPPAAPQAQRTVPGMPPFASGRPGTTAGGGWDGFQRGAAQDWAPPAEEANPDEA
jgi:hypothetical protein